MRHHHPITHPCRACDLYIEGFTEEHRAALADLFREIAPIIPAWCTWLRVEDLHGDRNNVAEISPMPEYRAAVVRLHAHFFLKPQHDRVLTLVHEIIHLATSPLIQPLMEIARGAMKKSDPLHDYHTDHLRRLEETVTEDLAVMISNLLSLPRQPPPTPAVAVQSQAQGHQQ